MEQRNDFYIILSSNAGVNTFPDNTLTHFRNKLPAPIRLEGGLWKVGLVEFQAPREWLHIRDQDTKLTVFTALKDNVAIPSLSDSSYLTPGHFKDAKQLCKEVKEKIQKITDNVGSDAIKVTCYDKYERIKIIVAPFANLAMSLRLSDMLGLDKSKGEIQPKRRIQYSGKKLNKKLILDGRVDLNAGLHSFFIYSDICQERIVGDARVSLLRSVPSEDSSLYSLRYMEFKNVHYIPVKKTFCHDIEILITDNTGEEISFMQGQVLCALHFKKE